MLSYSLDASANMEKVNDMVVAKLVIPAFENGTKKITILISLDLPILKCSIFLTAGVPTLLGCSLAARLSCRANDNK